MDNGEKKRSSISVQPRWGAKLFVGTLIMLAVFFWWLLIYSGGAVVHHG
jgi:hypothetical protein